MPRTAAKAAPKMDVDDALTRRCFPHRYRKTCAPFEYLDSIGIGPIMEYIIKGRLRIDVSEATDVPFATLCSWLAHNNYLDQVEEAEMYSAEGYLAMAQKLLRDAETDFDMRKARAMISHAEYMAERKNKEKYGTPKAGTQIGSVVYYNINLAGTPKKTAADVIEGTVAETAPAALQGLPAPDPLPSPLPAPADALAAQRDAFPVPPAALPSLDASPSVRHLAQTIPPYAPPYRVVEKDGMRWVEPIDAPAPTGR